MRKRLPDFLIDNQGTVWQFTPVTDRARNFAEAELGLEDWQWHGNTFVVDHRPAHDLARALVDEGFVVERGKPPMAALLRG